MKRQHLRRILIIGIVLLVGWFAIHLAANREPRYQGRALTEWLEDSHEASIDQVGMAEWLAGKPLATNAVRQIGRAAIPFLLEKLTAHDTAQARRFKSWAGSQTWMPFQFTTPEHEQQLGYHGFAILGQEALAAVPALVELTKNPEAPIRFYATLSLVAIGPSRETIIPIMLKAVKDPNLEFSESAAAYLMHFYPEEARKAGIGQQLPKAEPPGTNNVSTNAAEANK